MRIEASLCEQRRERARQDLLSAERAQLEIGSQRLPERPEADGMEGINQTLTLLWWKGAQFRSEDLLDLGTAARIPALPVALQLVGERLLYACGPPGRSHLLEHPRPL